MDQTGNTSVGNGDDNNNIAILVSPSAIITQPNSYKVPLNL